MTDSLWQCLVWLDAAPARYWTLAWSVFAVVVLLAFAAPAGGPETARPGVLRPGWSGWFTLAVFAALAAFRWPTWFVPRDLNPDEAQMIAGARTLAKFPVPWKYLDGTTHGPLCEYPLIIAHGFGMPFNYVTARVVAALMQGGTMLAVWGTLRCFTTERLARIATLPGLAFWCFVSWEDFVHYSTELPGLLLLALACWAVAGAFSADPQSRRRLSLFYLGGLCLGAVPFAKLQSAPQALAVAVMAMGLLWSVRGGHAGALRRDLPALVLGGLTVSVATLVFLLIFGLRGQFWAAYILSNVGYTGLGQHPRLEMPGWFFNFAVISHAFAWFLTGCLGFSLLYARRQPGVPAGLHAGAGCGWVLFGVSYFCVISPNREAAHYLHLLVFPATLLAGFILARAVSEEAATGRRLFSRPLAAFVLITLAPQFYLRVVGSNFFLGTLTATAPVSEAARYIREHAGPEDTLAVWGWQPSLFVETQLPQGTRDGNTSHLFSDWPLRHFYQQRYAYDLRRRRPAWFVDAIGHGAFLYESRGAYAHEHFPEVEALVQAHYDLVGEFGHDRVYRLRPDEP